MWFWPAAICATPSTCSSSPSRFSTVVISSEQFWRVSGKWKLFCKKLLILKLSKLDGSAHLQSLVLKINWRQLTHHSSCHPTRNRRKWDLDPRNSCKHEQKSLICAKWPKEGRLEQPQYNIWKPWSVNKCVHLKSVDNEAVICSTRKWVMIH